VRSDARSSFPDITVNKVFDSGISPDEGLYLHRRETLLPNGDRERLDNIPPNAMSEFIAY
jgi:hypothetical protein